MRIAAVVVVVSCAMHVAPRATAADAKADASKGGAAQKLQCARIWLLTSSAREPKANINLDKRGAEGGGVDIYVDGDMLRIEGQVLNESTREHFDYRFDHGRLVCSEEM